MSEREWCVVRGQGAFYVLTVREAAESQEAGTPLRIIRLCGASLEYADGFADALNLAAEDRSVLPEWNG